MRRTTREADRDTAAARPVGRPGFTLVELVVTVGVIALLTALLLPAAGLARERARRAMCLSNLHQVHTFFTAYALQNTDQVPLGHVHGTKQGSYVFYEATLKKYTLFGCLIKAGLVKDAEVPSVFFCPSQRSAGRMYDTATNPWPPPRQVSGSYSRAGYNCRPSAGPAAAAGKPVVQQWEWTNADPPARMAKVTDLKDEAVFADGVSRLSDLDLSHADGLNVLYGSGSARWVSTARADDPVRVNLAQCKDPFDPSYNPFVDAMWAELDKR